MRGNWSWLLLTLFGFFEYAKSTATKWISPIGATLDGTRSPPDKLTFAMIKPGFDKIVAVSADDRDIMDFFDADFQNICPRGTDPTNTAIENHRTLQMEFAGPGVCAIKLRNVPTSYVANTAGTITDYQSTLNFYIYYMVQEDDIEIRIPSRDAAIDSEIGTFTLTEVGTTATQINTVCNDPNFNGNLRYLYDQNKILLADPVDKRVKENWNDIVCLLKIKRNDNQMEYARATVELVNQNEPTAPICKLFPTRPDYDGSPKVGMLYYGKQEATCTITSNPEEMFTQTTPGSCDTTITLASSKDITTTAPSVTVQAESGESVTCTLPVVVILEPLQCPSNNVAVINASVLRLEFDLEFEDIILENPLSIHGSDTITYALFEEDQPRFEIEASTEKLKIKGSAIANFDNENYLVEYIATQEASSKSVTCTLTISVVSYGTPCDSTQ